MQVLQCQSAAPDVERLGEIPTAERFPLVAQHTQQVPATRDLQQEVHMLGVAERPEEVHDEGAIQSGHDLPFRHYPALELRPDDGTDGHLLQCVHVAPHPAANEGHGTVGAFTQHLDHVQVLHGQLARGGTAVALPVHLLREVLARRDVRVLGACDQRLVQVHVRQDGSLNEQARQAGGASADGHVVCSSLLAEQGSLAKVLSAVQGRQLLRRCLPILACYLGHDCLPLLDDVPLRRLADGAALLDHDLASAEVNPPRRIAGEFLALLMDEAPKEVHIVEKLRPLMQLALLVGMRFFEELFEVVPADREHDAVELGGVVLCHVRIVQQRQLAERLPGFHLKGARLLHREAIGIHRVRARLLPELMHRD
mmetsp:Transcript_94487/g.273117  ORF Transcript_94487/g.273117 Transcript_94487/m.273117 type:complete len:368 (+) Transcript_94487:737-1840(+)